MKFIENKLQGTGGTLLKLKRKVKNFLLVNGDSFVSYDLLKFLNVGNNKNFKILLAENKKYKENKKLINLDIDINKNVIFKKIKKSTLVFIILQMKSNYLSKIIL